ncbi:MAG: hypothetical protein RR504_04615 [Christensenellaceae bacterium]
MTNPLHLSDQISKILAIDGPVLCEVVCVAEQDILCVDTTFNKKHRVVKRPLEDLSPFMDRELFKSEMMIDPINED